MSGFYANWPKVQRPDELLPQMESPKVPFYFGGSQVPTALKTDDHTITGRGVDKQRRIYDMKEERYVKHRRF